MSALTNESKDAEKQRTQSTIAWLELLPRRNRDRKILWRNGRVFVAKWRLLLRRDNPSVLPSLENQKRILWIPLPNGKTHPSPTNNKHRPRGAKNMSGTGCGQVGTAGGRSLPGMGAETSKRHEADSSPCVVRYLQLSGRVMESYHLSTQSDHDGGAWGFLHACYLARGSTYGR